MLAEGIISLTLTGVLLSGCGTLLWQEWNRARCAYQVFEHTHAARLNRSVARIGKPPGWRLVISSAGVHGSGRCGASTEEVFLPWLENH